MVAQSAAPLRLSLTKTLIIPPRPFPFVFSFSFWSRRSGVEAESNPSSNNNNNTQIHQHKHAPGLEFPNLPLHYYYPPLGHDVYIHTYLRTPHDLEIVLLAPYTI